MGVMTGSYILFSSLMVFTLIYALAFQNIVSYNTLAPLSYAILFLNSLINPVIFLVFSIPARDALRKLIFNEVDTPDISFASSSNK